MLKRLLLVTCFLLSAAASAETQYITDELAVPLRRGPSGAYKIIHAGLPSGTPLEILAPDDGSGFTQVRTKNGTEGYVPTQYLVATPIARDRLEAANKRIESLQGELTSLRQNYKSEQSARSSAEGTAGDLNKQVKDLQTQLSDIRRVSANAVETYEENKSLKEQTEQLQSKVDEQENEIKTLRGHSVQQWLLIGGGLVVVGLIFGIALKARPKTRNGW